MAFPSRPGGSAADDSRTAPTISERPRCEPRELSKGTLLGRYVVLEAIGAGGMGQVYAAYDPELDRRVALKVMHRGPVAEGQARMQREAQALA
jgi:eukaryotic-like serine/threonine-protein kinase